MVSRYTHFIISTFVTHIILLKSHLPLNRLIANGTQIEAAIITANGQKLKDNLGTFFLAMPTLALVNNILKYSISQLRLGLRYKLSRYLYQKYISGLVYYRINIFDANLQNLDQLLTSDIEKFSSTITDVYTNLSKVGLFSGG